MDTTKFATKTDIKKLKTELATDIKFLKEEVGELKDDIHEIKESSQKMDTKLDRLQNTLDGFVGRVDDLSVDNEVGTHHMRELQIRVDDHEKRLKQIESSKQAA